MKTLNDNIKKGEYQKVYLIYGEEEYLKKQYKDRMKQAITVYVHSRMEKDITVIFRRPIILEQDILYGNS